MPPSNPQLNFFNIVSGEDITAETGIVYKLPSGDFQAEIGHGWWVAIRGTKTAAIKAVTKLYHEEIDKGAW